MEGSALTESQLAELSVWFTGAGGGTRLRNVLFMRFLKFQQFLGLTLTDTKRNK